MSLFAQYFLIKLQGATRTAELPKLPSANLAIFFLRRDRAREMMPDPPPSTPPPACRIAPGPNCLYKVVRQCFLSRCQFYRERLAYRIAARQVTASLPLTVQACLETP